MYDYYVGYFLLPELALWVIDSSILEFMFISMASI